MFYTIRHRTRFRYSTFISESIMEVRMQPRSDANQRCLKFQLSTTPRTQIFAYRDYHGNTVHHFDVPGRYNKLDIVAEATMDVQPPLPLPEALPDGAWADLDAITTDEDHWEMLEPSHYAKPTLLLQKLAHELRVERRTDPLTLLRELNTAIYDHFDYAPNTTSVDSPIDHALQEGRGVCQDFAHIMIALLRMLHVPARYVSGYLFHRREDHDRSEQDASHAWIEALLPGLGWVGFDPTNNLLVGERHIRVAVGRDYADVPPTRGIFKGNAESELSVGVQVTSTNEPPPEDELMPMMTWTASPPPPDAEARKQFQQQQQQQ
ncbi:MAG: transglutaminase family protein [Chloroflexaceae bacterium]|jgi:transglutaminase-like putative cysteine protease|nr:transglutaminase family protein [Chloroflexaceae bacterium]